MKHFYSLALLFMAFTLVSAASYKAELVSRVLLDNKVEVKIPKDFDLMKEEMLKVKYPSDRRPTMVYTNDKGTVNVAFNLTASKASQDLLADYQNTFVKTFTNRYPEATWLGKGVEELNGRKVGFVELLTPAADTKIYNLIFFTDLNGQLLLATFNCTEKELPTWRASAKEIMSSLKVK